MIDRWGSNVAACNRSTDTRGSHHSLFWILVGIWGRSSRSACVLNSNHSLFYQHLNWCRPAPFDQKGGQSLVIDPVWPRRVYSFLGEPSRGHSSGGRRWTRKVSPWWVPSRSWSTFCRMVCTFILTTSFSGCEGWSLLHHGEPGQIEVQCKDIGGLKCSQEGTLEGTIHGTRNGRWETHFNHSIGRTHSLFFPVFVEILSRIHTTW